MWFYVLEKEGYIFNFKSWIINGLRLLWWFYFFLIVIGLGMGMWWLMGWEGKFVRGFWESFFWCCILLGLYVMFEFIEVILGLLGGLVWGECNEDGRVERWKELGVW